MVTPSKLVGVEDDPWTLVDKAIATVPLFTKFDERERSLVISSLQHVKYDDGELVYRRGDHEPDAFFIVVSGTIVLLEPLFHTAPASSPSLAASASASASAGKPFAGERSAEQSKPGQRLKPAQWFVGSGTGDRTAVSRGSSACMRLPGGALGQLLQWFEGTRRMKALAGAGSSQASGPGTRGHSSASSARQGLVTDDPSSAASPSSVIAHSASSAVIAAARLKRRLVRKRSSRRTVLRDGEDSGTSHAESHQRLMMVREAVAGVSTLAAYSAAVRGMLGMGRPIVLTLPEGRFRGEAAAVKAALAAFARANLATDTLQQALKPVAAGTDGSKDDSSGSAAMARLAGARKAAGVALAQSRQTASLAVAHCWPVNLHDLCQAVRDLSREASVIVNGVRVNLRSREAIAGLVLVLTAAVTGSADFLPGLVATAEAEAAVAAAIESPQSRASRRAAAEAKALRDARDEEEEDEDEEDEEEEEEGEGGPLSEEELVQMVAKQAVALRADIELAATAAASSGGYGVRKRRLAHADGAARMVSDILVAATRTHSGGDALDVVFGTLMAPGLVTVAAEPAGSSECEILTAGESAVRVISTNSFRLMGVSTFASSLAGLGGVGGVGDLAGTRQGFANGLGAGGLGTMEQLLAAGTPSAGSAGAGSAGGRVTPGLIGIVRTTMEERLEYVSESEIGRAHRLPHRMQVVLERGLVETSRPGGTDGAVTVLGGDAGAGFAVPGTTSRTPRAGSGSGSGSGAGLPRASPGVDKSQFRSAGGIVAARSTVSSASPPESASTVSRGPRTRGSSMLGPAELELQATRSGGHHGHHRGMDAALSPLATTAGHLSAAATPSSTASIPGSPDDPRDTAAIKARIRGVGSAGPGEMEAELRTPAVETRAHRSIGSRMRKFLGMGSKADSGTAGDDPSATAARLGEAQRTGDWDAVLGSGGAGETPVQHKTSWGLGGMRRAGRSASSASEASASPESDLLAGVTERGTEEEDEEEEEEDEEAVELGRLLATVIDAATHGSVTSLLRGVTRSPLRAVRVTRTLRISFVDKEQAAASKPV